MTDKEIIARLKADLLIEMQNEASPYTEAEIRAAIERAYPSTETGHWIPDAHGNEWLVTEAGYYATPPTWRRRRD